MSGRYTRSYTYALPLPPGDSTVLEFHIELVEFKKYEKDEMLMWQFPF